MFFIYLCICYQVICWRDVPTDNSYIGKVAKKCEPYMRQVFVTGDQEVDVLKRQVSWQQFNLFLAMINRGD